MIRINASFSVRDILSAGGPVAKLLDGFESRPQQVQMACEIKEVLASGRCLVVEAATGVGKSFAYLVPAIELARQKAGRILISTFTITLQEQLISKDIPFLAECLEGGFTAVLAKGRGNYLCRRRLGFAIRRGKLLFDRRQSELEKIANWAKRTEDGSLSELGFTPDAKIWDMVKSEHGICPARRCANFQNCFYRKAQETAERRYYRCESCAYVQ